MKGPYKLLLIYAGSHSSISSSIKFPHGITLLSKNGHKISASEEMLYLNLYCFH